MILKPSGLQRKHILQSKPRALPPFCTTALARNDIDCNVNAGYFHDHIFVAKSNGQKAIEMLLAASKNYE